MIRDVYWPEATDEHGMFNGPASEYIGVLMPMLRGMQATSHMLGNIWIVLEGHRAKVETYMTAYHRTQSAGGALRDSIINGRYLDLVEKRGSEWRILKRAVVVAGVRGRAGLESGDLDHGIWSAGTVQGLIYDIPTVKELIDRIISEAESLISQRLAGLVEV
jgi:hypothetical protein